MATVHYVYLLVVNTISSFENVAIAREIDDWTQYLPNKNNLTAKSYFLRNGNPFRKGLARLFY